MAEQLLSVPSCWLNISDGQYRAIGQVALQCAHLENEIDREIRWLNERCTEQVKLATPRLPK
jgi:hypothetical protein